MFDENKLNDPINGVFGLEMLAFWLEGNEGQDRGHVARFETSLEMRGGAVIPGSTLEWTEEDSLDFYNIGLPAYTELHETRLVNPIPVTDVWTFGVATPIGDLDRAYEFRINSEWPQIYGTGYILYPDGSIQAAAVIGSIAIDTNGYGDGLAAYAPGMGDQGQLFEQGNPDALVLTPLGNAVLRSYGALYTGTLLK